jgi:hypothetical protein
MPGHSTLDLRLLRLPWELSGVMVVEAPNVVSRSSAEAEYRAMVNAAAECCWLRNLLRELHVRIDKATVIYCDNVSAVYLSENPVHHRRTKHVELDMWSLTSILLGQFKVLHIPTEH